MNTQLLFLIALGVLPPVPALAASPQGPDESLPKGFASWADVADAQLPQVLATQELDALMGTGKPSKGLEPLGFAGFAGLEIDVVGGLKVYWKGVPPSSLEPFLASLRGKHGIAISVLPSLFSRAELDRALAVILADFKGLGLVRAGHQPASGGLYVEVEGDPGAAAVRPSIAKAREDLSALAAQPVSKTASVDVTRGFPNVPMSRWNDSTPYWGGGAIWVTLGGTTQGCTTGFGVRDAAYNSYILTAAHCSNFAGGWTVREGDNSTHMGTVAVVSSDNDASTVPVSSGTRVFSGGIAGVIAPAESNRKVLATTNSVNGMVICTSGAFTGEVCGIKIKDVNSAHNLQGNVITPSVRAEHDQHASTGGQGDSGGPVFFPIGSDALFALGTMSALGPVATHVACTGVSIPGRVCGWQMFYPLIGNELSALGVFLKTE